MGTGKSEPQNIEQGTAECRSVESLRADFFRVIRIGRIPSFDIRYSLFHIGYSFFIRFFIRFYTRLFRPVNDPYSAGTFLKSQGKSFLLDVNMGGIFLLR